MAKVAGKTTISCPGSEPVTVDDGSAGEAGVDGKDGTNGTDGKDGNDGKDGTNGTDGKDGTDATPVTAVHPCPDTWQPNTELFLCISGTMYAVYDSGTPGAVHLTSLAVGGEYMTTDGRSCTFTVQDNCALSY